MTWVWIDDHFADHPKIKSLSDGAYRAFVDGLCYCARYLTDGEIPNAVVRSLAPRKAVAELERCGLWNANGASVHVHDYLEYQESREEVGERRAKRAAAGQIGGRRTQARKKRT